MWCSVLMGMERRRKIPSCLICSCPLSQSQGSHVIWDMFSFHHCLRNSCFCISMQDGSKPAVLWGYLTRISFQRSLLPFPDHFHHAVCSRNLCYFFTQDFELHLLTLSVMHLDMVANISHKKLFSAGEVRCSMAQVMKETWRREGADFLSHSVKRC